MDKEYIINQITAMLYANGEPVPLTKLEQILETDKKEIKKIIDEHITYLKDIKSGILIRQIEDSYQMCTNPIYFPAVRQLFEKKRTDTLSRAAYETLAIIAYNKEATRAKIESIRGNSDSPLKTLLERGLVIEAGRLEAPGRPVLYKPAEEFYRAFDVSSLDDLIPLDSFDDEEVTDTEETEVTEVSE
ncbi:MAG TPA: SMC-Scp complex subunit ScpB [Clostridia bacterium]|jgi:segregation and condensation protein B|nr:SMC-Scp complex subunit ScpB [Clostridiaceae bacterium]HOF26045.1 SMC-Scp complex subunit ScpB [Clostridia bacterium]HOM33512.1 SMC-Scp complex subunit ScpB [Clostridia bacterium]HOR89222.1 SMC-Scp complex subunit ScpB [Clostridia bacterium]HOT70080.1 SMC-Scp complex subunit ScpB [Clostridia bacterium]